MDIACQGQQFFLLYHRYGFFTGGFCSLFKFKFSFYRYHEYVISAALSLCHQGLENMLRIFIEDSRDLLTGHGGIRLIKMRLVFYFLLIEYSHYVCFVCCAHCLFPFRLHIPMYVPRYLLSPDVHCRRVCRRNRLKRYPGKGCYHGEKVPPPAYVLSPGNTYPV